MAGNQRHYTDDELLKWLTEIAVNLGRPPRQQDLRGRDGAPHPSTISKRFGSWRKALQAAGLPSGRGYTREEVLRRVKATADLLGRMPRRRELPVSYGVIQRWFGHMEGLRQALNTWLEERK